MSGTPKVVVLGMVTKIPVSGVVWQTLHYLIGLRRLGCDVHYVEAHARTPSMLMSRHDEDGAALAAAFLDRLMRRFDLADRWAYVALHDDGRCYGMTPRQLDAVFDSAAMVLNLHGGTLPRPEHHRTGRLVYLETDPVQLQVELEAGNADTVAFLEPHCAFYTFAEAYGTPGCALPTTSRFAFRPTRQPVVVDLWRGSVEPRREVFTTVANWRQRWRDVELGGEVYGWSKHSEFARVLDLPARTGQAFELALSGADDDERRALRDRGWSVVDAAPLSADIDDYRSYIASSLGEFTVAKDQNVRLRTGWFSDRSATYLAAGRPVVTQDTGFGVALPTGEGLLPFRALDEAAEAVARIAADPGRHSRAAARIAEEHFSHEVVLRPLLDDLGIPSRRRGRRREPAFPDGLDLRPASRRPTALAATTLAHLAALDPDRLSPAQAGSPACASVIVVAHDGLPFTRLCLEGLLADDERDPIEVVVVDNGSQDGTQAYLERLARRHPGLTLLRNDDNRGFPEAANQGLRLATGPVLVLLNNDVVVPPGWLPPLLAALRDPSIGLAGPCTNRIGNEAEIPTRYVSYREMVALARARARLEAGRVTALPMPAMFCVGMRRDVYARVGPVDERFGTGLLEDDDYAARVHALGLRTVCVEGCFVHHFGEASFGRLVPSGEFGRLISANRRRFAEKWGRPWEPYGRRRVEAYERMKEGVRRAVVANCADGAAVAVISRGDDELLRFAGRTGWHFPQDADGVYAGHYPADGTDAVRQLEALQDRGARYLVVPTVAHWWLEHYAPLAEHLRRPGTPVVDTGHCLIFDLEGPGAAGPAPPPGVHGAVA